MNSILERWKECNQNMSQSAIFAVVLAAGSSTRFGRTKQLEKFEGVSLAAGAVRKAESVCGELTVLVTGKDWQKVADTCAPLAGYFVINTDYEQGLASSIACGVRAVADSADAILLMLSDLPLVTTEHLTKLVNAWAESPQTIVASAFEDTLGPPIVFPKADFDALMQLSGDRGARPIIDANKERVQAIVCEEAAFDIDRPEDLAGIY
jgi:molybdenum cofactor cytidylyltransferase